jgi:hypothetical protein
LNPTLSVILIVPRGQDRATSNDSGHVRCEERLGGLLKYYHREAA